MGQCRFDGTSFKLRKLPENAQTPTTIALMLSQGSGAWFVGLRDIGYDFAIRKLDKLPIKPAIIAASISRIKYIGNAGLFMMLQ
jgi:hypothetical protein